MKYDRWLRGALVFLSLLPSVAHAQDETAGGPILAAVPPNITAARPAAAPPIRTESDIRDSVLRGRAQLDSNDSDAVDTLRDAAQAALVSLKAVAGSNPLSAAPESYPDDVVTSGLADRAAEAHLYWGIAADHFALRDEAITALTRAVRLSRVIAGSLTNNDTVKRDASLQLGRVLREGLPLTAPDDTLDTIAAIAHGGLWTPKRFSFDLGTLSDTVDGSPFSKSEFLVTDGKLFPPIPSGAIASNSLSRIPPFYQSVPVDNLPGALQLDKMIAGYARETSGPNKGQWHQIVRAFYASPYLTKNKRDDAPRARALCEQFLRVHDLFQREMGVTNLYTSDVQSPGVTTLWLIEVSALWPSDDDDPAVIAQLGPQMPNPNVGNIKRDITEPETTALMKPWAAIAGQYESTPGDIMFWKSSLARPETEWLRELCHEYGHVALPPFGGFRPPLEPYGNGLLGETLGALWISALPDRFNASSSPTGAPSSGLLTNFAGHVNNQALPALQFFKTAGPGSSLRASGTRDGLRYLQGLTVYLERVYGGKVLGRAFMPLTTKAVGITSVAERRSLMGTQSLLDSLDATSAGSWGSAKTLPIWLPGAMNFELTPSALISRADATLGAGKRADVTLYVPPGTASLRIDGVGAGNLRAIGFPFTATLGALRVYLPGRTGWQTFGLQALGTAKISSAKFEKK